MRARRLLLDTVALAATAALLASLTWVAAPAILRVAVARAGLHELALRGPGDLTRAYLGLTVAALLPAVATWALCAGFRLGAGRAPDAWLLVGCASALALAQALGVARQVALVASLLRDAQNGLAPMLTVDSLELPGAAREAGVLGALVLAVFVAGLAQRARRAGAGVRAPRTG